jgi:hypothetical protein
MKSPGGLEVLADKGVLNINDLIYIREHGMNEDKENGT